MYIIRERYQGSGPSPISDEHYANLDVPEQKMYYREVDEDEYVPTSNQPIYSNYEDDTVDDSLVENIGLGLALGIAAEEISSDIDTSNTPDTQTFDEFGGGDFGGGGSGGSYDN